jgi:sporulation protein YlmC with PRC-barrel domain
MKLMKNLVLAGSVACISATALSAQQVTTPPAEFGTRPVTSTLTKANKASNIIGMDVRNQQNEKLGDIKDLVLDLHTGRIAYAVLSVGGFLGIGDKYIAVPPSEFTTAPDGKSLILNADKARIEGAPGFAKNDWPDMNSWKSTHSSYWLNQNTALGTTGAAVSSGRQSGGTLAAKDLGENSITGRVTAFDRTGNMLTVEDATGKHQFKLNDQVSANANTTSNTRWNNVKTGDEVTVHYHNHNGSYVVDNITDSHIPNR